MSGIRVIVSCLLQGGREDHLVGCHRRTARGLLGVAWPQKAYVLKLEERWDFNPSICLSIHSSSHPSIHQSTIASANLFGHPSVQAPSVCLSIHPSKHPSIHPPKHPSIHPPKHPSVHPPNHPSIHPPKHPSIHPPKHPSIHPPISHSSIFCKTHLSFNSSIFLSICLSIHLSFIHLSIDPSPTYLLCATVITVLKM